MKAELPNAIEAKAAALEYVRVLISRRYTVEDAKKETHLGKGGPGEYGYEISRGKITVPGCTRKGEGFTFLFADLAKQLELPPPPRRSAALQLELDLGGTLPPTLPERITRKERDYLAQEKRRLGSISRPIAAIPLPTPRKPRKEKGRKAKA